MLAAAAARWRLEGGRDSVLSAFQWFERLPAPVIYAGPVRVGTAYRTAVPNNDFDIIASAWAAGREPTRKATDLRTLKTIQTTRLLDDTAVRYVWIVPPSEGPNAAKHLGALARAASDIVAVGTGVDVAVGGWSVPGDDEVRQFRGDRWIPDSAHGRNGLRNPVPGTITALLRRYEAFVTRVGPTTVTIPPPLHAFARVPYRREGAVSPRPVAIFSLLRENGQFRPFDVVRRGLTVAGMCRHAVRRAAARAGWSEERINAFVLGHSGTASSGATETPVGSQRFAFLPLPSLEARGNNGVVVGAIRRVALTSFGGDGAEVEWARRGVSGLDLVDEATGEVTALLASAPESHNVVRRYLQPSTAWATVTPVVLPGYDDPAHCRRRLAKATTAAEQHGLLTKVADRVEALLRKAIVQAGLPQELADHAELEWRGTSFWAGGDLASRYGVPDHLKRFPRLHLKIVWRDRNGVPVEVPGPICIGGGRYYGVGLLAAR
jgi:CRISPR-associated protein Csb2